MNGESDAPADASSHGGTGQPSGLHSFLMHATQRPVYCAFFAFSMGFPLYGAYFMGSLNEPPIMSQKTMYCP